MNNFSRIITLLRKERGITQKQVAMDLGISQALLSHYEKGLRECGLDFLVRLCDYYNVSSDYLLGRTADRNGTVLSVDDLPADNSAKDSRFTGSVLPTMNKRLIFSSLNILYDKLAQCGNKELTTKVSDYISMCIYKVFRIMYSSNKNNTQSLFEIKDNGCGIPNERLNKIFTGYFTTNEELADGQRRNQRHVQGNEGIGESGNDTSKGKTDGQNVFNQKQRSRTLYIIDYTAAFVHNSRHS